MEDLSALEALAGDFVAPTQAKKVFSVALRVFEFHNFFNCVQ